jgi:ADP-ribose pyrophosphatase YjhB (NUDIX family)
MGRYARYQGAIIRDHHMLLIRHRRHSTGESYWVIPGGGLEAGETAEECVSREMKEETCLEVQVLELLLDCPVPPGNPYQRLRTYLCKPAPGEARPGYEPEPDAAASYSIVEVGWFDLRDEAGWDPDMVSDQFTYPQMRAVRLKLGYLQAQ